MQQQMAARYPFCQLPLRANTSHDCEPRLDTEGSYYDRASDPRTWRGFFEVTVDNCEPLPECGQPVTFFHIEA
jgi:hypothetical protein